MTELFIFIGSVLAGGMTLLHFKLIFEDLFKMNQFLKETES